MITLLNAIYYFHYNLYHIFSPARLEQDIAKYLRHILTEELGFRIGLADSP